MDVKAELKKFIQTNFFLGSSEPLGDDDSFLDRNLIDSTGVLELVGYLESTHNIQVEDEEIIPENLDSIDRIVGFLERKSAAVDGAV
jgi:acyl carrier protein